MDTPGGVVVRPLKRIYDPTFWPLHHFIHIQDEGNGRGLAILRVLPGAVSFQSDGSLELVALRNATREKAFGVIGIPGNPASGHERTSYAFDYALLFTQGGDWRENFIPFFARSIGNTPWDNSERAVLRNLVASVITTDCPDIQVMAIKPASRGEGIIVRLYTHVLPESDVMVTAHHFPVVKAFLCDVRERDLGSLEVRDGTVQMAMPGTIATIK